MPEIYNELSYTVDLDKPIVKTILYNLFVTASKKAHKITLTLRRGGQDVPVSGSVTSTLITHADMVTQNATGSVEDGKAIFAFPPSFYTQSGMFDLLIFIDDQDSHVPVFCGEGSMILGQTDALYDPDNIVPSLAELLAQIEATRDAAAEASSAASSANTAAATANSAASRADTATGDANTAATAATNAATAANTAAATINGLTVSASGLAAGAAPTATVSETGGHKHIAFGLPQGQKGDTGATPNITIGTVTTGEPGTQADAALTGTAENPVLSLTIPQGKAGEGVGTVVSVNSVEPDAAGNVMLSAADVGAAETHMEIITLTADGWSEDGAEYTQQVACTIASAGEGVAFIVSPEPSNIDAYAKAFVYASAIGNGIIVFHAKSTPEIGLIVNVLEIEK